MVIDVTKLIQDAHQNGLYRTRQLKQSHVAIDFSANDYLSLLNQPGLQEAYSEGFRLYPFGSTGSMLASGYHPIHQQLEARFATDLNVDAGLLFNSGYVANLSLINLVARLQRHLYLDKASHASVYDGIRMAGLGFTRYRHQSMIDFEKKLKTLPPKSIIFTESVYSMSGHVTPLSDMASLAQAFGHTLFVDEAHAFGCYGKQGVGLVQAEGLTQNEVPLRVIPFGKALGGTGALVAGQADWITALLQCARPMIYSTAMSPGYTYGLLKSFDMLKKADDKRQALFDAITYFCKKKLASDFPWCQSTSAIQRLQWGCPKASQEIAMRLETQGIRCLPVRQPTVAKPETGLRLVLNADHQPTEIDRFFEVLSLCVR